MDNLVSINKKNFAQIKGYLEQGKIICFPTETVYGLGCASDNYKAVEKIYSIKERDSEKPLSLLVGNISLIAKIANISSMTKKLINYFSPGPITYVLPIKNNELIAGNIYSKDNFIGMRIPNHKELLDLLNYYNKPIIGTSCNLSGEKDVTRLYDIPIIIKNKIDYILEASEPELARASTVIKIIDDNIELLREGNIKVADINEFISIHKEKFVSREKI